MIAQCAGANNPLLLWIPVGGFTGLGDTAFPPRSSSVSSMSSLLRHKLEEPTQGGGRDLSGVSDTNRLEVKMAQLRALGSPHTAQAVRSARASTAFSSSDSAGGAPFRHKLPQLDLSIASQAEKVRYNDNVEGPSGMPISIVRTGSGIYSTR